MKVTELLEGDFKKGSYTLVYYPKASDFGLQHLYNNVVPAIGRIFKVPTSNIRLQSDHGYGWSEAARQYRLFGTERFFMQVILRRRDYDVELIAKLLPKALKNELSKQLTDVETKLVKVQPEGIDLRGRRAPPYIVVHVTAKYPQELLDRDRWRFQ